MGSKLEALRSLKVSMPIMLFILAALFYGVLCAKEYTWVFMSSDSGDWLAASTAWMVPQPYGSPLYILLGRFLSICPGDLVLKMTILLSILPSAVTVAMTYLIANKLTSSRKVALTSAIVLLGSAVFLTQSTVLEEYALTTMLLVLSFWVYLNGHRYRTVVLWGLAASIHVFVLGIITFWLLVEWRRYLKPTICVTLPIVAVFYSAILLIMSLDTPKLFAGGLNFEALEAYLTTTAGAVVGQLSIFEAPKRLLITIEILLVSFGFALIPLVKAFKRPITRAVLVMLGIVTWTLWYQITCTDSASWTFLIYASPFIAVLAGLGLSRLNGLHMKYVLAGALVLVLVNALFLNANILTQSDPKASSYKQALWELPDNSVVLTNADSYLMGIAYVINEGKDIVPLVYPYMEDWEFWDYYDWLRDRYGNIVRIAPSTFETIALNLEDGVDVYYANSPSKYSTIRRCFDYEDTQWPQIKRIVGFTGLDPEPFIREVE